MTAALDWKRLRENVQAGVCSSSSSWLRRSGSGGLTDIVALLATVSATAWESRLLSASWREDESGRAATRLYLVHYAVAKLIWDAQEVA